MAEAKVQFNILWNKFDAVYEHETSGRHDLKTFRHFLEERAKIEETYASSLIKLQAKEKDFEAQGSHAKCWADLKSASKTLAEQHQALAATLNKEIGVTLDAAVKKMKTDKEKMQAEHKSLLSQLNKKQSNHEKAFSKYKEAVKAAETAVINRDGGLKEHLPPPKQQALEDKVKAALDKVDKSHLEYQTSVNELKNCQVEWDSKLREHLDAFELMERERLACMTEQFKRSCEAHLVLKNAIDQLGQFLNTGISEITSEKDMHDFVVANTPDSQPPTHVVYEPVVSEILNHARNAARNSSMFIRKETADAPPRMETKAVAKAPPPSVGPAAIDTKQSIANAVQKKNEKSVVALYDFESDEPSDLHFKAGDNIKVIDHSDPHWWKGELNGKEGVFPSNYVEERAVADEAMLNGNGAENPRVMDARAEALYDFVAQGADELSFKAGDILHVTGELNQWYLGKSSDGNRAGIFPSNYVTLL